jgi:hypothetical protein
VTTRSGGGGAGAGRGRLSLNLSSGSLLTRTYHGSAALVSPTARWVTRELRSPTSVSTPMALLSGVGLRLRLPLWLVLRLSVGRRDSGLVLRLMLRL